MSNNVDVLLVGAGNMGIEYYKVIRALGRSVQIICRKEQTADSFYEKMGERPISGGLEDYLAHHSYVPEHAIVAVDVLSLTPVTKMLVNAGVKNILVEKPGGKNRDEIDELRACAKQHNANVYIAYNRRYYASTRKAIEIIQQDGGVSSFTFEFTEWSDRIQKTPHPSEIKEEWLLANSSHVIDLAFFLGGYPKEMTSYATGALEWHSKASRYAGAGLTEGNATFSYNADWAAPGRWSVEIMTHKHRLILKPLERLFVQDLNSVSIEEQVLDDRLDKEYKPGLYRQVESFLDGVAIESLVTIYDQCDHMRIISQIEPANTRKHTMENIL